MRMQSFPVLSICILSMLFLTSCSNQEQPSLIGKWNATKLEEDGKILDVQLDKIHFSFDQNDVYHYESTLKYRESGHYQLKSKYLYTTDTLNQASIEKVVEIVKFTDDTILIRMEQDGKERMLTLAKDIN